MKREFFNNRIIHVIDSLHVGGAEILLKNTISVLPQFNHVIVYLKNSDVVKQLILNTNVEFICLNYTGWFNLLTAVLKLKRLINQYKPLLVHSHLFYSSVVARLSVPKDIPLVTTLHSCYSIDAFQKNKKTIWVERLTLKKRHTLIGVSKFVIKDYLNWVHFKGKNFVLYNFLPDTYFERNERRVRTETLKCVAVGNLKEAKNYSYLLEMFKRLKRENITLDIYGSGYLQDELQNIINTQKLKVVLCGTTNKLREILPKYDLFIQASEHEGFGISVIEAIASGLPVFISDIPVFREITSGFAHFFPLNNALEAAKGLMYIYQHESSLDKFVQSAYNFVQKNYRQEKYVQTLLGIYKTITETTNN